MMKGLTRLIWIAVLFLIIVPAASLAYTVNSMQISPSGSLTPGTTVDLSWKIQMPSGSTSANSLQMYTQLEKPKWSYIINVNGVANGLTEAGTKTVTINSFLLTYKSADDVSVTVTLEGTAPAVTQTENQTLIQISDVDGNGHASDTKYTQSVMVVNTNDVTTAIANAKSQLSQFRTEIDEKAALDIDTSAAEAKYNEAQAKITSAQSLPSTQYSDALNNINTAISTISDGGTLLDKAWAEKDISEAQGPINNVDSLIAYFQGNTSTSTDARLSEIITKREVAVSYISAANDALTNGNFAQARAKAGDAYSKGNESYNDALTFKASIQATWNPFAGLGSIGSIFSSSVIFIIVGVIAVVLIIVGIIIYRKRARWDELG
ncbi:hypothetical protein [Methanoregula sp.]|uniref:hypothetical protein n=1 Tax=Methanoregula sp. TaxID=2052170 RepID=UPI0035616D76